MRSKEVLWDSIPKGGWKSLLVRVACQNASIFITFYSIRQFELTTVAMVTNSATFVICLLGWLILKEQASAFSLVTLTISFGGTVLVLLGETKTTPTSLDGEAETQSSVQYIGNLVILLINPIIIGCGVIAMRQMRKMHESVITSYMNLMLLAIMLVLVYATGSDLTPWKSFGWVEWLMLAGLALSNVGSQIFRFRAVQRS